MKILVFFLIASCGIASEYEVLIEKYSKLNDLPAYLVKAIISVESSSRPTAKGKDSRGGKYSHGLMQLKPISAKDVGFNVTIKDLYDSELNIKIGSKYFAKCLQHYAKGNLNVALDMYNRGPTRVKKFPYKGDWKEHPYVGKILIKFNKYGGVYGSKKIKWVTSCYPFKECNDKE